jgi:hypothetical protein
LFIRKGREGISIIIEERNVEKTVQQGTYQLLFGAWKGPAGQRITSAQLADNLLLALLDADENIQVERESNDKHRFGR